MEGSFAVADSVSISKHSAEALATRDKDYIVFDGVLTGFGVRVMPSGKRFFLIQYRKRGKTRRLGLGQFGPVTAEIARREATRLLADVRAGDGDPVAARDADRQALTMEELGKRFLREHADTRLKPSTAAEYRRSVELFINPFYGKERANKLTSADVGVAGRGGPRSNTISAPRSKSSPGRPSGWSRCHLTRSSSSRSACSISISAGAQPRRPMAIARSVACPLPVEASEPWRLTRICATAVAYCEAQSTSRKRQAAVIGPIVCDDDGPMPTLKTSKMLRNMSRYRSHARAGRAAAVFMPRSVPNTPVSVVDGKAVAKLFNVIEHTNSHRSVSVGAAGSEPIDHLQD